MNLIPLKPTPAVQHRCHRFVSKATTSKISALLPDPRHSNSLPPSLEWIMFLLDQVLHRIFFEESWIFVYISIIDNFSIQVPRATKLCQPPSEQHWLLFYFLFQCSCWIKFHFATPVFVYEDWYSHLCSRVEAKYYRWCLLQNIHKLHWLYRFPRRRITRTVPDYSYHIKLHNTLVAEAIHYVCSTSASSVQCLRTDVFRWPRLALFHCISSLLHLDYLPISLHNNHNFLLCDASARSKRKIKNKISSNQTRKIPTWVLTYHVYKWARAR